MQNADSHQGLSYDDLIALGLLAIGVLLSVVLRGMDSVNAGPLFLGAAVLTVGLRRGPLAAWLLGLASGLFVTALFNFGWVNIQLCLNSLGLLAVCTLFPIPWIQEEEGMAQSFERRRHPLEEKRDFARAQLEKISSEVAVSEQLSREIDALYHAGREISKLLTMQDTLDFSREIIRDTLQANPGAKDAPETPFVLLLADEEELRFRVGVFSGVEEELARRFEAPLAGGMDLVHWLKARPAPLTVANAAHESSLKGIRLPTQVRGFASVPLLIQEQAIGFIVALDLGEGSGLQGRDLSNLRILASQVAIGIEKAALYDKVQRLSITDGLTGLYVHRHFQARMDEEIKRAERYKEPLSLLMLDIDFFKKFNDNYGHLAGDAVLKEVARVLKGQLEDADILSRYGGEEFAVILPKQDKPAALKKAEALRSAIEATELVFEGKHLKITVSAGLACLAEDAMTKKGVIDKADQALYRAKESGRNRVVEA